MNRRLCDSLPAPKIDPAAACAWRCLPIAERIELCTAAGVPDAVDAPTALCLAPHHRKALASYVRIERIEGAAAGLAHL